MDGSLFGASIQTGPVVAVVYSVAIISIILFRNALASAIRNVIRIVELYVTDERKVWCKSRFCKALAIGVICELLTLFLYSPSFWLDWCGTRCQWVINEQALDPLGARYQHVPVAAYRIVLPGLAYVLGISGTPVLAIPIVANILTFCVVWLTLTRWLPSRCALMLTIAISLTIVGQIANVWVGFPDPINNFLVALMLYRTVPWVLFLGTGLGLLTDERIVLACPFVLLWAAIVLRSPWQRLLVLALCMIGGIFIGLLVREGITLGLFGPNIGDSQAVMTSGLGGAFKFNLVAFLAPFTAFRGLLLLPFAAILVWPKRQSEPHDWFWFYIWLVSFVTMSYIATWPDDLTRSAALLWPSLVIAAIRLGQLGSVRLEPLLVSSLMFLIFLPMVEVSGLGTFHWTYPLPMSFVRTFMNL